MEAENVEDDETNELETRIKAPIVWGRIIENLIRIEDLQERKFDEALIFLRDFYFDHEFPFKQLSFSKDEESVKVFLSTVRIQMKDKTSLVAIDEDDNKIIAVMILRVIDKDLFSRTFDRIKILRGDTNIKIFSLFNFVENTVDIHEVYQCKSYLKLYHFAIHPEKFNEELYRAALQAIASSATSLKINIVSGIFTNSRAKLLAQSVGFEILNEISYNEYSGEGKTHFEQEELERESVTFMMLRTHLNNTENSPRLENEKETEIIT